MKDITNSKIARDNILNNRYAVEEIQIAVGLKGVLFENEYKFTKKQIADFFEVSERAINACIHKNDTEITENGYEVGFVSELKSKFEELGRKLTGNETNELYAKFEKQRLWEPLINKARSKMASRDLCFRDAVHDNLSEYISIVSQGL